MLGKNIQSSTPTESDEFNSNTLGLQWQWMANPAATFYFMNPSEGLLRLYSQRLPDSAKQFMECT